MKLMDVIHRQRSPKPWAEGEKIPWHDPAFSRRMLAEHLSQEHDAASRRFEIIDQHVRWIHQHVLQGVSTSILDLGCGPGLYTSRLAELGHKCTGIDFSTASIAYARDQAEKSALACRYIEQDIREADYGDGYGLVMSIYGEINVFRPRDAKGVLLKAQGALQPGGLLLLEPHTFEKVYDLGMEPPSWHSAQAGLFSDEPYLLLQENFWDAEVSVAIERYYVIDAVTGATARHSISTQAYTNLEYQELLTGCGFGDVAFYPSLGESAGKLQQDFICILARKREG
jgi:SAM-dependent methyltransferase